MKRLAFLLTAALTMTGCAQMFDYNLYAGIDKYQSPDASTLSSMKTAQLNSLLAQKGAYEDLKANPDKLAAVETALNSNLTNATTTADKVDAATTLVNVLTNATSVGDLKATAVKNVKTLSDALSNGDYIGAIQIFLAGKTEAEIKATLDSLDSMSAALATMETATANPVTGVIDKTAFFASATANKASFAQSCMMAAIAHALIKDNTDSATAAAGLVKAQGSTGLTSGNDMTAFDRAKKADASTLTLTGTAKATPGSGYSYAYVATVNGELAI